MSSLFDHRRDLALSPFNKVYRIRNKNKDGHKNILLNVRSLRSPETRSSSLKRKSSPKLFKQAHRVPSQTTLESYHVEKSQNDFLSPSAAENQKMISSTKTRRANTLEQKKRKITFKKKYSQEDNIQKTVEVCVNGQTVLDAKQTDLVTSLTRLIMEDGAQDNEGNTFDLDSIFGESCICQDSFELQIDSNLVKSCPQLMEWSELMKRI